MSDTVIPSLVIRDERFSALFTEAEPVLEMLAEGFSFAEGPLWHPGENCLLFSDIPSSRIHRWNSRGEVDLFRAPSGMSNGLALDGSGRVVCCEHATSRLTRMEADGGLKVLASRYEGRELNSPNDLVVASSGEILFTDPVYGREEFWGLPRAPKLAVRGVYSLDPETLRLSLLADDFLAPNGLCLSRDEHVLFVNDSERNEIRRFVYVNGWRQDLEPWACLEAFGEGSADGMKLDAAGNIFCCGPGGVHVFSADAEFLGLIGLPEFAANLAFGGRDLRDLFLTASTRLLRLRTKTPGRGAPASVGPLPPPQVELRT